MGLPHIQIGDGMIGDAILSSVEVTQELNRHWWCTVVCRVTQDDRVPVENLIGKLVNITTVDDDGVEHTHFAGAVQDVTLDYELTGSYMATLRAVSDSYRMDVTAHKQYYQDGTLASVASLLAARHTNTKIAVNTADTKPLNYVQYGETDWNFLHRIVDDHAAWMRPVSGGVEIFDSFQSGTTLEWRTEGNLTNFRLQGRRNNPTFSGAHYDHHAMASNTFQNVTRAPQLFDGAASLTAAAQAASQQLPSGFEPQRGRAMTLDHYSDQLQAEGERSLGSTVTGTGSSRNQNLKAGDTVKVQGPLDAQGTYGVVHVTHRWTPKSYSNDFGVTPWKQYRDPAPPEANTWNGIVPARVVDHNDPKKMGRLKVQFFWQDGATHWARATSPHAGPGRGFMFLPEVGDEGAVAFEAGDPERPVILGSLWNGVQQAPRAGYFGADADIPDNNVKRIYTKAGNRLQLVDTPGKQTVVMATPHQTSMTLSESHGATGRPLVHVHSSGDILLTAPNGRVHIQSLIFTQEIGNPADGMIPGARAAAAVPPIEEHHSWLGGFAEGLFDSTIGAVGHMIAHPIQTAEGLGHAIAHPVTTVENVGKAAWSGGRSEARCLCGSFVHSQVCPSWAARVLQPYCLEGVVQVLQLFVEGHQ